MAGSKPKGVAQQLFEAQQRRAAHKAALEKAARAAEEKEKRAAARREAAAARQAQRAAQESAKRQQAADARQVQQVLREMEKRETLRQRAEARETLARERDAARGERGGAVQQLKNEAAERTPEVERRVRAIRSVLTDRDRGLEPLISLEFFGLQNNSPPLEPLELQERADTPTPKDTEAAPEAASEQAEPSPIASPRSSPSAHF